MSKAYTPELREKVFREAEAAGIQVYQGVYAMMPGPSFETPAEIRMLIQLSLRVKLQYDIFFHYAVAYMRFIFAARRDKTVILISPVAVTQSIASNNTSGIRPGNTMLIAKTRHIV